MKCDALKPLVLSINDLAFIDEPAVQKNFENPHDHAVYKATEVDAAIAELKQKLEDAQATAYADSVDAGMENRRLKRALWLARAYRGRDNSILLPSKFMRNVWDNVERKCLKKSKEYL